jgi:hypothetical protein
LNGNQFLYRCNVLWQLSSQPISSHP